jgi:hypothetical protein
VEEEEENQTWMQVQTHVEGKQEDRWMVYPTHVEEKQEEEEDHVVE